MVKQGFTSEDIERIHDMPAIAQDKYKARQMRYYSIVFFFTKIEQKLKNVFFSKVRFSQHFPPKILFFVFDFCAVFAAISLKKIPCGAFA